jgi:Fic family protein
MRALPRQAQPLTGSDLRNLHRLVVCRSHPDIAGRYADQGRYVLTDTGRHNFPSSAEIAALMGDFAAWLRSAPDTPETAFSAHGRLIEIHPFNDGNGRVARLLMNLLLMHGGYQPVAVRPEDRPVYIRALQEVQAGQGPASFNRLLYEGLDATLGDYLRAANEALPTRVAPTLPKLRGDEPAPERQPSDPKRRHSTVHMGARAL